MEINDIQPLSQARLRNMSAEEIDKAETIIIQHIVRVTEQHCAEAGWELKMDKKPTSYWFLVGLHLHAALIPHIRVLDDTRYFAFLRGLFEDVFDLLIFAYDGAPAYPIAEMTRAFGSGLNSGPTLPRLLPARARPLIAAADDILDAQHEDYMRRLDQMGY